MNKKTYRRSASKNRKSDEIISKMQAWGFGARAEIFVQWDESSAHVFVAENRSGKVHFLDPQTGELDVEYYFDAAQIGLTKFFRIDNLEPNEMLIAECCEEVKR